MPDRHSYADANAPQQAIGQAIQTVTAARLGRGFVPLAGIAVAGGVQWGVPALGVTGGWTLIGGAAATALAMLAFGLRNVQLAFGRAPKTWMNLAMMGSMIPAVFTFYVFAWRGLRVIAIGDGLWMRLFGLVLTGLGMWAIRSWMKLVEVQKLAQAMIVEQSMDGREMF
jgi:hypothetical protein